MFRLKYVVAVGALALTGLADISTTDAAFAASCNSLPQLTVGNCADAFAIDIYASTPASDAPTTSFSPSLPVFNSASAGLSSAYAATSFGVNRASASRGGDATVGAANGDFGSATSTWTDQFVITGGTGTGLVTFGTHIDGTTGSGGSWFFVFCQGVSCSGNNNSFPFSASSVSTDVTETLAFTYGIPFLLSGVLGVDAGHDAGAFVATFVDFSSTAILDEVILPDGAILSSESGKSYPLSATPLPATLPLLAGGLGVIAVLARRRKQKAVAI